MTTVSESTTYDELKEHVRTLLARTRGALESDHRAAMLAPDLPELDESPVRIALAGAHNAGKSMLIGALCRLPQDEVDAITAAVPLTSEITPYEWSGHVLLDLPGTLSGLEEHDEVAAKGVRRADVLLLATSVELPGEAETRQIDHLLATEGFAQRTLVVLNKCNSEDNDPDLVRAEMRQRLAAYPSIDLLFADAKEFVESRNAPDVTPEDRAFLRAESGIDEVEAALSALVKEHGRAARLQALCQEVRRTAEEASTLWQPYQEEEADEVAADRIRLALASARVELTDATDLALATLSDALVGIGNNLASTVDEEDGSLAVSSTSAAAATEEKALAQCGMDVNRAADEIISRLDAILGTTLEDRDRYSVAAVPGVPQGVREDRIRRKRSKLDDTVDKAVETGLYKLRTKLNEAIDAGVRDGSPLHDMAKKINAVTKEPIKPYTHRNRAEKLAKRAKFAKSATDFVGPLVDVKGSLDNIRRGTAIKKRREDIRSRYAAHAVVVVAEEREDIHAYLERQLGRRHEVVATVLDAAVASASMRTEAQARWTTVAQSARDLACAVDRVLAGEDNPVQSGFADV